MKKVLLLSAITAFSTAYGQQKQVTVKMLNQMTDSVELQKNLTALEQGNEQDLRTLAIYYSRHNPEKREKIVEKSISLYPLGDYAWTATESAILTEKDPGQRKKLYEAAKKKFKGRDLTTLSSTIVANSVEESNLDNALFYIKNVNDPGTFAHAARRINTLDQSKGEQLFADFLGKHREMEEKERARFLAIYTNVLVHNGKHRDAAKFAKEIFPVVKDNQEFINDYASILAFEGNDAETIKILEEAYIAGLGSKQVDNILTASYENTGMDAIAKLDELQDKMKTMIKENVLKTMITEPAPQFVIKDIHGKDVTLADFKGKTIVIDFWSTWCGPCKAAFPAMQRAVDRYKEDKDVQFLFVHTWQETPTPLEDAMAYLKENNYRFDLYMDYRIPDFKGPVMQASPAITAFGAEGIPTKYIIDGEGNIRFTSLGYSYKDEVFVEELSAMIDYTKAAK